MHVKLPYLIDGDIKLTQSNAVSVHMGIMLQRGCIRGVAWCGGWGVACCDGGCGMVYGWVLHGVWVGVVWWDHGVMCVGVTWWDGGV